MLWRRPSGKIAKRSTSYHSSYFDGADLLLGFAHADALEIARSCTEGPTPAILSASIKKLMQEHHYHSTSSPTALLLAFALGATSAAFAQAKKPAMPIKPSATVPFVGCKSDGQVGPQDAPTGKPKIITISSTVGSKGRLLQGSGWLGCSRSARLVLLRDVRLRWVEPVCNSNAAQLRPSIFG